MIILKNFKFLLFPLLLFLFYPSTIAAPTLNNISLEELDAFEQELAKMSPEEWEALNAEINNTINNMTEEERQKLFEEAALEAERLEAEFRSMREQRDAPKLQEKSALPKVKANDSVSPKKSVESVSKPKVNQTELNKNLEILNNLSLNLDYLQLMFSSYPIVKIKLENNPLWIKFQNEYYLLHSMINSLLNNNALLETFLLSEWDTLREDIKKWNTALNFINEIQCSDLNDDISNSEAEAILFFVENLLRNNPTEKLTWSLKRMMQKYAEDEFKKIEKFNSENKQVYRFPTSRKDFTSVKLGFSEKKNIPASKPRPSQPRSDFYSPPSSSSYTSNPKKSDLKEAKPEPDSTTLDKTKSKSQTLPAPDEKKQDTKKTDDRKAKEPIGSSDERETTKKVKSFAPKKHKRLIDKLKLISKDIKVIYDDILDEDGKPKIDVLRQKIYDKLVVLSFELGQIQIDLMEFLDKNSKMDLKLAADLEELLDYDKPFPKNVFKFVELKDKLDIHKCISSFDILLAINKSKNFKIDERLKNSPETVLKNFNNLMKYQSLKPQMVRDLIAESEIKIPQNLIYDIADRLLTITALSENSTVKNDALLKLRNIRLVE